MADDLKSILMEQAKALPAAPKLPTEPVNMPMQWVLGQAYNNVRKFDPELLKNVQKISYSPMEERTQARVFPLKPNNIQINELYDEASAARQNVEPKWFDALDATRLLGHEAQHVDDFTHGRGATNWWIENSADKTENALMKWLYAKMRKEETMRRDGR